VPLRWIVATVAVMAVGFLAIRSVDADVAVALAAAGVLLVVGRASGLDWNELGLAKQTWRRGLLYATGALLLVLGLYAVLLVTPLDVLLDDDRYDQGLRQAWVTALLVVPLGTVLWEELAFRGVLWAQLARRWSTGVATVVSSLLFGLWHALPALRFADANEAVGTVADSSNATIGTVLVTIVVTSVGGVILCELRRRSGSLLAPIGLHWAVNGLGVLAVALASSR
jgi:membrane protease YdiL (CAAX protease family)